MFKNWRLNPVGRFVCKYFSPFCGLSFHSVLWLSDLTECIHRIFTVLASISGHSGCLHVLAIPSANSAAVNTGAHASFQSIFSSGYEPRRETARPNGRSLLSFNKQPYCSPQWLCQLTFPPAVQEGSLLSTPLQHLLFLDFLMMAILTCVKC